MRERVVSLIIRVSRVCIRQEEDVTQPVLALIDRNGSDYRIVMIMTSCLVEVHADVLLYSASPHVLR